VENGSVLECAESAQAKRHFSKSDGFACQVRSIRHLEWRRGSARRRGLARRRSMPGSLRRRSRCASPARAVRRILTQPTCRRSGKRTRRRGPPSPTTTLRTTSRCGLCLPSAAPRFRLAARNVSGGRSAEAFEHARKRVEMQRLRGHSPKVFEDRCAQQEHGCTRDFQHAEARDGIASEPAWQPGERPAIALLRPRYSFGRCRSQGLHL
jgi:hypothetical protein